VDDATVSDTAMPTPKTATAEFSLDGSAMEQLAIATTVPFRNAINVFATVIAVRRMGPRTMAPKNVKLALVIWSEPVELEIALKPLNVTPASPMTHPRTAVKRNPESKNPALLRKLIPVIVPLHVMGAVLASRACTILML
jgi:hypothetical protein